MAAAIKYGLRVLIDNNTFVFSVKKQKGGEKVLGGMGGGGDKAEGGWMG